MSLKRYSTRRDRNEPEIRRALMRVGATFLILDAFDLLVLYRGQLTMLEIKTPKGRATRSQQLLVLEGWPLKIARTIDEALIAIGAMRPPASSRAAVGMKA